MGTMRHDINYCVRWSNRSAPCEPVKDHDMYFSFDDIGGIEGVGRWLAVAADHRTELSRVMATRYREGMVLEDRIMNASAALDSFVKHRRANGRWVKYAKRVWHCVDLAGQWQHSATQVARAKAGVRVDAWARGWRRSQGLEIPRPSSDYGAASID